VELLILFIYLRVVENFFEYGSKPSTKRGPTYRTGSANVGFTERILLYGFSVLSLGNLLRVATADKTELLKLERETSHPKFLIT